MSEIAKVLKRAVKLAAEPADDFPELARCLADIHDDDRSLLREFIEESGMGKRKAYYLVELGTQLRTVSIPDECLRLIG